MLTSEQGGNVPDLTWTLSKIFVAPTMLNNMYIFKLTAPNMLNNMYLFKLTAPNMLNNMVPP